MLTFWHFSNLMVEIVPDIEGEIIDPPKKKIGRPPGAKNRLNKKAHDARYACEEAGIDPFLNIAWMIRAMQEEEDPDLAFYAHCNFKLMQYLAPTYQAMIFTGLGAAGEAVTINMNAFVKPQIPAPKTNGSGTGNGRGP